jgi:hypothetical protein
MWNRPGPPGGTVGLTTVDASGVRGVNLTSAPPSPVTALQCRSGWSRPPFSTCWYHGHSRRRCSCASRPTCSASSRASPFNGVSVSSLTPSPREQVTEQRQYPVSILTEHPEGPVAGAAKNPAVAIVTTLLRRVLATVVVVVNANVFFNGAADLAAKALHNDPLVPGVGCLLPVDELLLVPALLQAALTLLRRLVAAADSSYLSLTVLTCRLQAKLAGLRRAETRKRLRLLAASTTFFRCVSRIPGWWQSSW